MSLDQLRKAASDIRPDLIDFCRRLVQTPSETGTEGAAAKLFAAELRKLGIGSVVIDGFGNVCGRVRGASASGNLLLSGHLDHVGAGTNFPGAKGRWRFEPYEGRVSGGYVWGRGASDVKGSLAAQVYAAHLLRIMRPRLAGDVIVAAVVNDEPSFPFGIGHLLTTTLPELGWAVDGAVTGSATDMTIALGHMGKVELEVSVGGVSRHVSQANQAVNPIYEARELIDILDRIGQGLPRSATFGREVMAPTIVETLLPAGAAMPLARASTIPSQCIVTVNWRFLPGRTKEIVAKEIASACLAARKRNPRFKCSVRERTLNVRSYRGVEKTVSASCASFLMEQSHPHVRRVESALRAAGQPAPFSTWPVPTYGGFLGGTLAIPTVGYSPCAYRYNHTPNDRVSISALFEATVGYAAIAMGMTAKQ
jgi:putative selenium metabolism hydrolase